MLKNANARRQRGVVLVPIILFVLLVAGLSMSLLIEAEGNVVAVRHKETSMAALEIAEMGLVQAELEMCGQRDNATDGVGNVSGAFAGGTYVVTAVQDPNSDERWTLTATGTHGHSVRRVEVSVRRRARSNLVEGLYAKEDLTFGGSSKTDAFDSRLGTYAGQAVNADAAGPYAEGGGDIGSGMGITVLGTSTHVRGNAIPGPGFSTDVSGGATVWGDTLPRMIAIDLPPTPYQEFLDAYNTNNNAELLGANAVSETEAALETVEDADLEGLTDTQVDSFVETDLMTMTEAQAAAATFDSLLTDSYATLISTLDATLLTYSTSEYEGLLLSGGLTFEVEAELDDGALVVEAEATGNGGGGGGKKNKTSTDSGSTTTSGGSTNGAGRVSYNATTGELRATAGARVILNGGTYFFSDIRLVGNSTLVVRGPSKVYVTGRLDLGGGSVVNETGSASSLQIFAHPYALPAANPPSTTLVKVRGGSAIAASIYAPEVPVTVGGGDDFYGAIIGKTVALLGGVYFHYDKALGDLNTDRRATLERLYWRELNPPRR